MRIRRGGVTCGLGFLIKRVSKINTYVESGKFKMEIQDLQDGYLVGGGSLLFMHLKIFAIKAKKHQEDCYINLIQKYCFLI